jgi:hypothetical protein
MERNVGTWDSDANGEATSGRTTRARVRRRRPGAEQPVVARKSRKRDGAKGLCYGAEIQCANQQWEEPMSEAKPFCISKWEVLQASKSESRSGRGRRTVDCGLRKGPEREPVQDLESDVVGQLLSTAGADGEDTESKRWGEEAGHTDRIGSDCATGGEIETWSRRWIRCSIRIPTGIDRGSRHWMQWGRRGSDAGAMLDFRSGHQGLLR